MRSKEVSRRLGSIAEVRASIQTHRDRIASQVEERYTPASTDAAAGYPQTYFDHMDHELATVETRLVEAEDAHIRRLVRLAELRRRRGEVVKNLYDKQVAGRGVLADLYKGREFELTAVEGSTPQKPQALAEQVDQTVKLLRDPGVEIPEPAVAGIAVEFEAVALDLETSLKPLQEVRGLVTRAAKAADGTRQIVHVAIEAYDRVFPWVAQNLESLFRLVGERELADRIRTSARRVTRRRDDDPKAEAQGDEALDAAAEAMANEAADAVEPEADTTEAAPAA
ncbi:MAG: hypothetical protein GY719_32730 [bacterium]|nr:hypothetical protein [bacterium]